MYSFLRACACVLYTQNTYIVHEKHEEHEKPAQHNILNPVSNGTARTLPCDTSQAIRKTFSEQAREQGSDGEGVEREEALASDTMVAFGVPVGTHICRHCLSLLFLCQCLCVCLLFLCLRVAFHLALSLCLR